MLSASQTLTISKFVFSLQLVSLGKIGRPQREIASKPALSRKLSVESSLLAFESLTMLGRLHRFAQFSGRAIYYGTRNRIGSLVAASFGSHGDKRIVRCSERFRHFLCTNGMPALRECGGTSLGYAVATRRTKNN